MLPPHHFREVVLQDADVTRLSFQARQLIPGIVKVVDAVEVGPGSPCTSCPAHP